MACLLDVLATMRGGGRLVLGNGWRFCGVSVGCLERMQRSASDPALVIRSLRSHFPHTHPYSRAAESATEQRRLTTSGLSTCGTSCALDDFMSDKRIVYVIRSRKDPERHYVGLTSDLPSRLASHNAGESPQTRTLIPWALVVSVQFASADAAIRFERFLKSSSGRAFAKHYFE